MLRGQLFPFQIILKEQFEKKSFGNPALDHPETSTKLLITALISIL